MIIAIDGPSGAGKSTLAKRLAKELGFIYVDTGAMYRALALKVLREGVDLADDASMARLIGSTTIDLRQVEGALQVLLDGADVAAEIRTPQVSQMASKASALGAVRARLLELQRDMARRGSVVAEGRDIGTVVFPQAEVKIFLQASAARACAAALCRVAGRRSVRGPDGDLARNRGARQTRQRKRSGAAAPSG